MKFIWIYRLQNVSFVKSSMYWKLWDNGNMFYDNSAIISSLHHVSCNNGPE